MQTAHAKALSFFVALLALATGFAMLLSAPETASAGQDCKRMSVKVSRKVVPVDGYVRVSGRTCAARDARPPRWVRIRLRTENGWRTVAAVHTRRSGFYTRRVRIRFPAGRSATRIRARARDLRSRSVRVRLAVRHGNGDGGTTEPVPTDPPTPDPDPDPDPTDPPPDPDPGPSDPPPVSDDCSLDRAGQVSMTERGCRLVATDTVANPNPVGFWGMIDCAADSRHSVRSSGGDPHVTAMGAGQGNGAYRRLTVLDGDDIWGERCELGFNNHKEGPTAFYREGMRRATYASIRLPEGFNLSTPLWQTVFQMKQAQPSANGGDGPILEMNARSGKWMIFNDWNLLFDFPAEVGVWTRFVFDVYYSQDPNKGWIQVSMDLNGDGDFGDTRERSPRVHAPTLRRETVGGWDGDGIAPGESIPSHLRSGVYHHPGIPCIGSSCTIELDNVQVLAP